MNRELQQVRRYWPKAKMSCQLLADGAVVWTLYAADRSERLRIVVYADGRAAAGKWAMATRLQQTIAEAMRAAGFGARPEYATRGYHFAVWRAKKVRSREQVRLWRAGCGWSPAWLVREYERFDRLPELVSTQRPRKGARLGKRKREALRRI